MTAKSPLYVILATALVFTGPAFAQGSRGTSRADIADQRPPSPAEIITAPTVAVPPPPAPAPAPAPVVPAPAPVVPAPAPTPAPSAAAEPGSVTAILADAIRPCWSTAALTDAERGVSVTLRITLNPDGTPAGVRFLSASADRVAEFRRPYQTARQAISDCGSAGFALPADSFDSWRETDLTFFSDEMRIQ